MNVQINNISDAIHYLDGVANALNIRNSGPMGPWGKEPNEFYIEKTANYVKTSVRFAHTGLGKTAKVETFDSYTGKPLSREYIELDTYATIDAILAWFVA